MVGVWDDICQDRACLDSLWGGETVLLSPVEKWDLMWQFCQKQCEKVIFECYLHFYSILRRPLSLWEKYLHFRLKTLTVPSSYLFSKFFWGRGSPPKIVFFRALPKIPLPRKQKEKSKSTSVAGLIRWNYVLSIVYLRIVYWTTILY